MRWFLSRLICFVLLFAGIVLWLVPEWRPLIGLPEPVVRFSSLGPGRGNVSQSFAFQGGRFYSLHGLRRGRERFNVVSIAEQGAENAPFAHSTQAQLGHGQVFLPLPPSDSGYPRFLVEGSVAGTVMPLTLGRAGCELCLVAGNAVRLLPLMGNLTAGQADGAGLIALRGRLNFGENLVQVYDAAGFVAGVLDGKVPVPQHLFVVPQLNGEWFQGITVHGGAVVTLTGDNSLSGAKTLRRYTLEGALIEEVALTRLSWWARWQGVKFEPEGLVSWQGQLFYAVMTGQNGDNRKYLLRVGG